MNVTSKLFNTLTVLVVLSLCVTLTGCGNSDSGGSGTASAPTNLSPEQQKAVMKSAMEGLWDALVAFEGGDSPTSPDDSRRMGESIIEQVNAINLSGTPRDFSDAFVDAQKAMIVTLEGYFFRGVPGEGGEQLGKSVERLKDLCKKYDVAHPFPSR